MGSIPNPHSRHSTNLNDKDGQKKRIGTLLVDAGIVSENQLKEALTRQAGNGSKTVDELISLGYMNPTQFADFLAQQPGVPRISLANCDVPKEVVKIIPEKFAIEHEMFPIDRLGGLLTVGMVCPLDSESRKELERMTGLRVKPILCSRAEIQEAFAAHYRSRQEVPVERRVNPRR